MKVFVLVLLLACACTKPDLSDGYFVISKIDDKTFALSEPRYYQENVSYLLVGDELAMLFDTGPGFANICDVVASVTTLPLRVVPSHLHYDHTGNLGKCGDVDLLGTPERLAQVTLDGYFTPGIVQHLGWFEGIDAPRFKVANWIASRDTYNLGGRRVQVLQTPGHTDDSVMLFDEGHKALFAGDFLYAGHLLPSDLPAYLRSTDFLLKTIPMDTAIYGGHGVARLGAQDLVDLQGVLHNLQQEDWITGTYVPGVLRVNSRVEMVVGVAWGRDWKAP